MQDRALCIFSFLSLFFFACSLISFLSKAATPEPPDSMQFMQMTCLSCFNLNETSRHAHTHTRTAMHARTHFYTNTYAQIDAIVLLFFLFFFCVRHIKTFTRLHKSGGTRVVMCVAVRASVCLSDECEIFGVSQGLEGVEKVWGGRWGSVYVSLAGCPFQRRIAQPSGPLP